MLHLRSAAPEMSIMGFFFWTPRCNIRWRFTTEIPYPNPDPPSLEILFDDSYNRAIFVRKLFARDQCFPMCVDLFCSRAIKLQPSWVADLQPRHGAVAFADLGAQAICTGTHGPFGSVRLVERGRAAGGPRGVWKTGFFFEFASAAALSKTGVFLLNLVFGET